MSDRPARLIVSLFAGPDTARDALKALQQLKRQVAAVKLGNVAIVSKNAEGKVDFTETDDVYMQHGAVFGSLVGLLVGGLIIGAPIGAGIGAAVSHSIDLGFPNHELRSLGEGLTTGQAALLTLVDDPEEERVLLAELRRLGGAMMHRTLAPDVLARLGASGAAEL